MVVGLSPITLTKYLNMRQKANTTLNIIVGLFLKSYPDLRYIQALYALGIIDQEPDLERGGTLIVDRFYEEPADTLKRCKERIARFLEEKYPYMVKSFNEYIK